MKNKILVVSKMNCYLLTKELSNNLHKDFYDLSEIIVKELGPIDEYRRLHGDIYLEKEREFLDNLVNIENQISFVSYDIFKHHINMEIYKDCFIIMLDFGYFIRVDNEIVRMKQSIRYQKAKSICDYIIDCRNASEKIILQKMVRAINEK